MKTIIQAILIVLALIVPDGIVLAISLWLMGIFDVSHSQMDIVFLVIVIVITMARFTEYLWSLIDELRL